MKAFVDVETGVVAIGNKAKWRLKQELARDAEYDGRRGRR
jgi:hypothetical protein